MGDADAGRGGGLQDGGALRHGDGLAVDREVYHSVFLPPLKMP